MDKLQRLEEHLRGLKGGVFVALSGGVDSTFLLYLASRVLGDQVVAGTVVSQLQTDAERGRAEHAARRFGARHVIVELDIFDFPEVTANPAQRCYHCKKALFKRLRAEADRLGLAHLVDATNADDLAEYRPGIIALEEMGVESPLVEVGIGKEEIRRFAAAFGLPGADQPSSPCLATRVPYGTALTLDALRRVAAAEELVRAEGFPVCRVRDRYPAAIIEVPSPEIERISSPRLRAGLARRLHDLGYTSVAVDLDGFRSGSMSEILTAHEPQDPTA